MFAPWPVVANSPWSRKAGPAASAVRKTVGSAGLVLGAFGSAAKSAPQAVSSRSRAGVRGMTLG